MAAEVRKSVASPLLIASPREVCGGGGAAPETPPAPTQGPGEGEAAEWYLGFDVATKSFAFSLLRHRPSFKGKALEALRAASEAGARKDGPALGAALAELEGATRGALTLVDGEARDLAPGRKDKEIHTVNRVELVLDYLEARVYPALKAAEALGCPSRGSGRLRVAIEYQMGPNSPARVVQVALVGAFVRDVVFIMGPALKNKLRFPSRPDLDYCRFMERYARPYDANKAHTVAVYKYLESLFDFAPVMARIPAGLKKDQADSAVQLVAFILHGDLERSRNMY